MFPLILLVFVHYTPTIACGPPAAIVGVATAFVAYEKGIVSTFDNQFFDPIPPASWPQKEFH